MKDLTKHSKATPKISVFSANHNIIRTQYGTYFTSYDSVILFKPNDESTIYLGPHWDYSRNTVKHLCRYLNTEPKTLREDIKHCIKYKLLTEL